MLRHIPIIFSSECDSKPLIKTIGESNTQVSVLCRMGGPSEVMEDQTELYIPTWRSSFWTRNLRPDVAELPHCSISDF